MRKVYLSTVGKNDPLPAQRLAGHTNIATTGLYLDAHADEDVAAPLGATEKFAKVGTARVGTVAETDPLKNCK